MSDAPMPAPLRAPAGASPRGSWRSEAGLSGLLHAVLFAGFMVYTFVGTRPFADASVAERLEGNPLDRVVALGLVLLALAALVVHHRAAARLFLANIPLIALTGFCLLSTLWSDYPGLTLRRAILLVFLTTIAAGIAVGLRDLRRFHSWWFVGLTGVMLVNLVGTALWPGIAVTDIGVRGLYTQKNVAGLVAMITVLCGATWIFGARGARPVLFGLLMLLPAVLFLVLTRSKTSIGLTGLALAVLVAVALAERWGTRFVLLMIGLGLAALATLLGLFAAYDFELDALLNATLGDASFTGRDELWAFALRSAEERFWLGHGYGAFWDVGLAADPLQRLEPGTWLGDVEIGTINQAHNGYLELWLHVGLPATLLATWIVARGVVSGAAQALAGPLGRPSRAAIGFMALLLLITLLHNLTEATLFMRGTVLSNVVVLFLFLLSRSRTLEDPEVAGRRALG
ncbi:exopolysaccharide biosynthesis protein [Kaistia sp. 32K]|uniref:O-antigen ligase family protein n=1 Tax=Kaistia sp. 32K TaxID=2795690 RepID=UPI0019155DF1|nr:O-antigen ligase family protein [Kaistia sp. 32K]BCP51459.1 exopolysaccharide biosynthesis protein [Kaistia sp. 32K]